MSKLVTAPPLKFKMPGWESVWSPETLAMQAATIGRSAFERGYQQKPQVSGELLFPSFLPGIIYFYNEDWRKISDPDSDEYNPEHPAYINPSWPRFTGVDLSDASRPGNVIFTVAVSPDNVKHVIDIRQGAWKSPRTAKEIQAVSDTHWLNPKVIYVENNAYQKAVIDWMEDAGFSASNKIYGFNTGKNKTDHEIGLPSIEVQYNQRQWRVSVPHSEFEVKQFDKQNPNLCVCGFCVFIRAVQTFTAANLAPKCTPDVIAAQFICKEAARQRYSSVSGEISIVRVSSGDVRSSMARASAGLGANHLRIPTGVNHLSLGMLSSGGHGRTDDFGRKRL